MQIATRYADVDDFLNRGRAHLGTGCVALIFAEDDVEVASTIAHHARLGFATIIVFADAGLALPERDGIVRVDTDQKLYRAFHEVVNRVATACPAGTWVYYCFNAEYLFYPFCETRSIAELLRFHGEERRASVFTSVLDLYARDVQHDPSGVSMTDAHFDRSGYYALARNGPDGAPLDRQLDLFGGLRWRFEEHVPEDRRHVQRIAIFKTDSGARLRADHTMDQPEMNTYACPWHHNATAAICSFRAAKALRRNPGSHFKIDTFEWEQSERFEWRSRQLLELGFIEPGQWF